MGVSSVSEKVMGVSWVEETVVKVSWVEEEEVEVSWVPAVSLPGTLRMLHQEQPQCWGNPWRAL